VQYLAIILLMSCSTMDKNCWY